VGLRVWLGGIDALWRESRQTATRAQKLRFNGAFVSDEAFNMRKAHFNRKKEGALREKVQLFFR